jgi:Leucine-rich repeat (LRR) protein
MNNRKNARVIEGLDLSIKCKDNPTPYIGNGEDLKYELVLLAACKTVEFIPIDLLKKFPKFEELGIVFSEVIQVPKNLFTADLKMLQALHLFKTKTERIDVEAFTALTELKVIHITGNEVEEIPHKLFEKNLKLEEIDLSENLIHSLHPELFDGLVNLKEVDLMNNLRFSKKIGQENIPKLKEELKLLFDSYIKKYGKKAVLVPVEVPNWQQKFEKLQIEIQKMDQKYKILLKNYNQSKQELQDKKGVLKTSENPSIGKVSSELLKNYEKLKDIDGDIALEFQDGKHFESTQSSFDR